VVPALYAEVTSVAVDVKAVRVMLAEGKLPKQLNDKELAGLYCLRLPQHRRRSR
jgi:hypothetical protein